MADTQTNNDGPALSTKDFQGTWILFDDKEGPCRGDLVRGRVVIDLAVVNPDAKLVVEFDNLEGFPVNVPVDADFLGNSLGFKIEDVSFKIIRCDRIGNKNRVIHCTSLSSTGPEPGSWTAEEEDGGKEADGTSKAGCETY